MWEKGNVGVHVTSTTNVYPWALRLLRWRTAWHCLLVLRYDENVRRKRDLVLLVLRATPRMKQVGLPLPLRWRRPSRGGSLIIGQVRKIGR